MPITSRTPHATSIRSTLRSAAALAQAVALALAAVSLLTAGCGQNEPAAWPARGASSPTAPPDAPDQPDDRSDPDDRGLPDDPDLPGDPTDRGAVWILDDGACSPDTRVHFRTPDGHPLADFAFVHDGERFHLIYIRREQPNWPRSREGSKVFGHCVSADLAHWTALPDIDGLRHPLHGPDHIWAPHVFLHDGQWWMFYTGVVHPEAGPERNEQRILVATSPDLTTWSDPALALDGASDFSTWGEDGDWRNDCRDPTVVAVPGGWAMYAAIRVRTGNMAVGMAFSTDLRQWQWVDWIRCTESGATGFTESPTVWRRDDGRWYLFWTPNDGTLRVACADQPLATHWTPCLPVPFGRANEILPLPDGSCYFTTLAGSDRVDILRLVDLGPGRLPVFSQVVRPACFRGAVTLQSSVAGLPHAPANTNSAWGRRGLAAVSRSRTRSSSEPSAAGYPMASAVTASKPSGMP